jgi:hypothetical protein
MGSVASAYEDPTPHASPDGRFVIINIGDTTEIDHSFELRRADGTVLYAFKGELSSFAENITWSPDSGSVALRICSGKYLRDTVLINCTTGKALTVPTTDPDAQTTPIRWTKRGELIVETAAPYGGRADDDLAWAHYQYRRTFRVRDSVSRLDCVFEGATVYPSRAVLRKQGYKPN